MLIAYINQAYKPNKMYFSTHNTAMGILTLKHILNYFKVSILFDTSKEFGNKLEIFNVIFRFSNLLNMFHKIFAEKSPMNIL